MEMYDICLPRPDERTQLQEKEQNLQGEKATKKKRVTNKDRRVYSTKYFCGYQNTGDLERHKKKTSHRRDLSLILLGKGEVLSSHLWSQSVSSEIIFWTVIYHGNNLCAIYGTGQLIQPTIGYFSLFVAAEQEPNIAPES